MCRVVDYNDIQEIYRRRYLLKHTALEVFLTNGKSLFLVFNIVQIERAFKQLVLLAGEHILPENTSNKLSFLNTMHHNALPFFTRSPDLFYSKQKQSSLALFTKGNTATVSSPTKSQVA